MLAKMFTCFVLQAMAAEI